MCFDREKVIGWHGHLGGWVGKDFSVFEPGGAGGRGAPPPPPKAASLSKMGNQFFFISCHIISCSVVIMGKDLAVFTSSFIKSIAI